MVMVVSGIRRLSILRGTYFSVTRQFNSMKLKDLMQFKSDGQLKKNQAGRMIVLFAARRACIFPAIFLLTFTIFKSYFFLMIMNMNGNVIIEAWETLLCGG
ncbi:MAG: hypothetical protein ABII68_11240 [Pseudomonadota bacterium]